MDYILYPSIYLGLLIPPVSVLLFITALFFIIKRKENWLAKASRKALIAAIILFFILITIGFLTEQSWTAQRLIPIYIIYFFLFLTSIIIAVSLSEKRFLAGLLGGWLASAGIFIPGYLASILYNLLSEVEQQSFIGFLAAPAGALGGQPFLALYWLVGFTFIIWGSSIGHFAGKIFEQARQGLSFSRMSLAVLLFLILAPPGVILSSNLIFQRKQEEIKIIKSGFSLSDFQEKLITDSSKAKNKIQIMTKLSNDEAGWYFMGVGVHPSFETTRRLGKYGSYPIRADIMIDGEKGRENGFFNLSSGTHEVVSEFVPFFENEGDRSYVEGFVDGSFIVSIDVSQAQESHGRLQKGAYLLTKNYETKFYKASEF